MSLLWHKIVLRREVGTISFGRAGYSHLLCYSRTLKPDMSRSTADVFPAGQMTWSKAMGVNACLVACRFVREQTLARLVIDPFCGRGTVLAVANKLGLDALGIELSRRKWRYATELRLP